MPLETIVIWELTHITLLKCKQSPIIDIIFGSITMDWVSSWASKIKDRFEPTSGIIGGSVTKGLLNHRSYISGIFKLKRIIHNPYVPHVACLLKSTICELSTPHLCFGVRTFLLYIGAIHFSPPLYRYSTVSQ